MLFFVAVVNFYKTLNNKQEPECLMTLKQML